MSSGGVVFGMGNTHSSEVFTALTHEPSHARWAGRAAAMHKHQPHALTHVESMFGKARGAGRCESYKHTLASLIGNNPPSASQHQQSSRLGTRLFVLCIPNTRRLQSRSCGTGVAADLSGLSVYAMLMPLISKRWSCRWCFSPCSYMGRHWPLR